MNKVSQTSEKVKQNFSPENAAALEKRGLTPEQIEEMGLLDAESDASREYPTCYPRHDRGILIPYKNIDTPYARRRNAEPLPQNDKGEDVRYSAPVDENHLYWLPCDAKKIHSPKTVLLWTEGEFKTARLSFVARLLDTKSLKYAAIGGGGVWNFQTASNFKEVPALDREHVLFFDADAETNSDVRRAAYRLTALLVQRGASLKNIRVATWNESAGKGIDDYLQQQDDPAAALKSLLDAAQPVVKAYPLDLESAVKYFVVPGLERQHISQLSTALSERFKADGIPRNDIKAMFKDAVRRVEREDAAKREQQRKKDHPNDPHPVVFWIEEVNIVTGIKTISIDWIKYLNFLAESGFGLLRVDDRLIFVRIQNKIVSENLIEHGENKDIKDFVLHYLETWQQPAARNAMLKGHAQYFTLAALNALPYVSPSFCRDTKDTAFLFFKNGFVQVTKTAVTLKPYKQLPGHIWEKQILKHEYHGVYQSAKDGEKRPELCGEMLTFFELITSRKSYENQPLSVDNWERDTEKLSAFLAAYGYLLHGYKDRTEARAVLCVDNSLGYIDDDGRTGKSLFCESLLHLKNVLTENGKTWNVEDRFAFQDVSLDTQVIFVDDISPKFNFKALYPAITGNLACEGKGVKKVTIPFTVSPKFVITSNNPVKGEGASDLARQWVLPFSRFFSTEFMPKHYFGHRLFDADDWDNAEWQRFFDFAIYCIGYFLAHGFVNCADPEFERAKLLNALPEEALTLFDGIEKDWEHEKEGVKEALPFDVSGKMFTKYAKIYAKYRGFAYEERETSRVKNGVRENHVVLMVFKTHEKPDLQNSKVG